MYTRFLNRHLLHAVRQHRPYSSLSPYEQAVSQPSKLVYGSNNEHVNSEKLLLGALDTRRARVLTVCGGGDNFLSILAHDHVESVTCVDMNPFQLALGQLKLALACSDIPTQDVINFLGMNQSLEYNSKRLEMYENIEPTLPKEVASLFRENLMHEVEVGISQVGGEINSIRYLQRVLEEEGFSREDVWNRRIDLGKFEEVCSGGIGTPDNLAKAAFLYDTYPETYRKRWNEICPLAGKAYFQAVSDPQFEKTFTKALFLLGKYDMATLPEWLLPSVRKQIQAKRHKVIFVNSGIDDIEANDGKFVLISTSNIFDWVEKDKGTMVLTNIVNNLLAPDGCVLIRMAFSNAEDLARSIPNTCLSTKVHPNEFSKVDYCHFLFNNPSGFAVLEHFQE